MSMCDCNQGRLPCSCAAPVLSYRQSFEAHAAQVVPGARMTRHGQGPRTGQYVNPSLQLGWLFYQAACSRQRRRAPDEVLQLQHELAVSVEEANRLRTALTELKRCIKTQE